MTMFDFTEVDPSECPWHREMGHIERSQFERRVSCRYCGALPGHICTRQGTTRELKFGSHKDRTIAAERALCRCRLKNLLKNP